MGLVLAVLLFVGLMPLGLAFWANRRTSLAHALVWAGVAWACWALAVLVDKSDQRDVQPTHYCALCLTGCAGVAVLGARRPHVFAWNFVVLGLFAVMLLPLVETTILGTRSSEGLRAIFLAATIAVGILNYLPTRLAPAALLLMLVCQIELIVPFGPESSPATVVVSMDGLLAVVPWIAWICWRKRGIVLKRSAFDRLWLDFRDRWGLVWSQRVREQFNFAAQNAGWPVKLTWQGLVVRKGETIAGAGDREKYVETLRAILQRFLPTDHHL